MVESCSVTAGAGDQYTPSPPIQREVGESGYPGRLITCAYGGSNPPLTTITSKGAWRSKVKSAELLTLIIREFKSRRTFQSQGS